MSLCVIDCADKELHHVDLVNPGTLPSFPSKVLLAGRSGCGKGSTTKNLVMLASPPYQNIVLVHYDPKGTKEWDDVEPSAKYAAEDLPSDPAEFLDRNKKNCLILDEINFEGMSRALRGKFDRLFMYVASHYSCSIFLLQQNYTSIPVPIRRACDWWVIYPSVDVQSQLHISRTTGFDVPALKRKWCKTKYDNLTFDFSGDGPELRLNVFYPITQ